MAFPDAQKSPTESWRLIKAEKIKQVDENGPAIAAALHPENLPAPHWYGCVCVINAFLTTWCTDVPSMQAQFTYCHHFWERRAVTQHMLGLLRSSLCIRPHMWTEAGDAGAESVWRYRLFPSLHNHLLSFPHLSNLIFWHCHLSLLFPTVPKLPSLSWEPKP